MSTTGERTDDERPSPIRDHFCDALHDIGGDRATVDDLCRACIRVLPFDGAGISFGLHPEGRLPLGASDVAAATAERLQFTTGIGPCSTVQRSRSAVLASEEELTEQWPGYAAQLLEQTDYRSSLSLPVTGPLAGVVVLDL